MPVVTTVPAACRTAGLPRPVESIAPRTGSDLLLLFGTVAMALGLAAVTASLKPSADALGDPAPAPPRIVLASGAVPEPSAEAAGDDPDPPPTMAIARAGEPRPGALPHVSATGPWASPLYPQNGVTLWDRIRVSSKRDRQAFLFGTSIQIHAPETAATPGPRSALPPCCPQS
jgi:hypothetical protein